MFARVFLCEETKDCYALVTPIYLPFRGIILV